MLPAAHEAIVCSLCVLCVGQLCISFNNLFIFILVGIWLLLSFSMKEYGNCDDLECEVIRFMLIGHL